MSQFVEQQWEKFCGNIGRTARHVAAGDADQEQSFLQEIATLRRNHQPDSYPELLNSIAVGTDMAIRWRSSSPGEVTDGHVCATPQRSAVHRSEYHMSV